MFQTLTLQILDVFYDGDLERFRELIHQGLTTGLSLSNILNTRATNDFKHYTFLHFAIISGHCKIIQEFLISIILKIFLL